MSIAVDVGERNARRLPSGGKGRNVEPDPPCRLRRRRLENGERADQEDCTDSGRFRGYVPPVAFAARFWISSGVRSSLWVATYHL